MLKFKKRCILCVSFYSGLWFLKIHKVFDRWNLLQQCYTNYCISQNLEIIAFASCIKSQNRYLLFIRLYFGLWFMKMNRVFDRYNLFQQYLTPRFISKDLLYLHQICRTLDLLLMTFMFCHFGLWFMEIKEIHVVHSFFTKL